MNLCSNITFNGVTYTYRHVNFLKCLVASFVIYMLAVIMTFDISPLYAALNYTAIRNVIQHISMAHIDVSVQCIFVVSSGLFSLSADVVIYILTLPVLSAT